jgi:hypothetical protein
MKTIDSQSLQADPIITEVRRAKTALAAKYNFDVVAMVRALQEREKQEKCEQGACTQPSVAKAPSGE